MVGVAPCRDDSVLDALNTRSEDFLGLQIETISQVYDILVTHFFLSPYSMAVGTPTLDTSVANLSSNLGGTPRSIRPLTQAYRYDYFQTKRELQNSFQGGTGRAQGGAWHKHPDPEHWSC